MPWVSVREPFASPPRLAGVPRTRALAEASSDFDVLHGRAYITGVAFDGDASVIAARRRRRARLLHALRPVDRR